MDGALVEARAGRQLRWVTIALASAHKLRDVYRISSKSRRTSNCRRPRNLAAFQTTNALNAALEFSPHTVNGRQPLR